MKFKTLSKELTPSSLKFTGPFIIFFKKNDLTHESGILYHQGTLKTSQVVKKCTFKAVKDKISKRKISYLI